MIATHIYKYINDINTIFYHSLQKSNNDYNLNLIIFFLNDIIQINPL